MSRRSQFPILPAIVIVSLLAAGLLAFNTGRNVLRNYQLRQDEAHARAELRDLQTEHEQLVSLRDYLKSEQYVEEIARRVLGLVRPGETLVVVTGTQPAATPTPAAAATPGAPWWRSLFYPNATPAPRP